MRDSELWQKFVDIDFAQEYIILYSINMYLESIQDGAPYIYEEHIIRHAENLNACLIEMLPYQGWFDKHVHLFPFDLNQWKNNYADNKTEFWEQAAALNSLYKTIISSSIDISLLYKRAENDFEHQFESIMHYAGELYQLLLDLLPHKQWFKENTPMISCLFVYAAEIYTNQSKRNEKSTDSDNHF